jgi:hypothetical protein
MTDRTTDDLRDAYKRRFMIHVCKDGTVTYRDTVTKEKVFNGRALPVFSVDTVEEAKAIQIRFCGLQYGSHPLMRGKPWYKLNEFSGELEDLDRVRAIFALFYKEHKAREVARTAELVSRAVRTRKPRKARKPCA